MLQQLTSRIAILKAIAEYDKLGAESFLSKYGFGPAKRYLLLHNGNHYDSKAIAGVAYGIQFGRSLTASDFSGGIKTVVPKLKSLGFEVVADQIVERFVALPEEAETSEFWEGAQQSVIVNKYERSPQAKKECIRHYGTSCFICNFDFAKSYGDDFMGFIHVHHIVPLSAKRATYKVNAKKDLRPVCPNCHAILHYGGQTRSIKQVKKLLQNQATWRSAGH